MQVYYLISQIPCMQSMFIPSELIESESLYLRVFIHTSKLQAFIIDNMFLSLFIRSSFISCMCKYDNPNVVQCLKNLYQYLIAIMRID